MNMNLRSKKGDKMIVSVFGKNGSGKSTVAIHLSQYLSMQNKFVGLISLERRYGSIQRSLGVTVLESRSILNALSQEDIKEYFTKYNDSMYILSLADEDDITKYDAITKLTKDEKILLDFFKKINQLFDYVIIDLTEKSCRADRNSHAAHGLKSSTPRRAKRRERTSPRI